MIFNLSKDNYKEIEFMINSYIDERKLFYLETLPDKVFGIDISISYKGIISSYSNIDSVEFQLWNAGIKVDVLSSGSKSSFYYRADKCSYANVSMGNEGGGSLLPNKTWYYSDLIRFHTA